MGIDRETTIADLRKEESWAERMKPEPKRVQCYHCTGYFDEDEIEHKPMCYECKEKLDSYHRILTDRNLFLGIIENIQICLRRQNFQAAYDACDGILANYKEE